MNILILRPDFNDKGGVAAYYSKLKYGLSHCVEHYIIGRRPGEKDLFKKITRVFRDYAIFIKKMSVGNYDVVHVNPSLDSRSFIRDGLFILIAKTFGKKTITFFHGWHKAYENRINKKVWLFRVLYGKTNLFIVLADEFKKALVAWGCKNPIVKEVIVIEDDIVSKFNIHDALNNRRISKKWNVLFLSRIIHDKGIYETIEAISILGKKYERIELIIAGDGEELDKVKSLVRKSCVKNVSFVGYVTGIEKYRLLERSHILCFPSYSEGFPNTIVEAMAFGLPVVTRPVGGIADFFKNGNHGFATTSKKAAVFAQFIEMLLTDTELYEKISLGNYQYAKANFLASHAAERLGKIYESI